MKRKVALAVMLSVFLAGGTTAYGASNSEQPVQINVSHHDGYHHNSCFSTLFSSAVKRAAVCSTNAAGCVGNTTHHIGRVDCVYPQVPDNEADNSSYQNDTNSSSSYDYSNTGNYSNSEYPSYNGSGYQGGYHHSESGHHGRGHH